MSERIANKEIGFIRSVAGDFRRHPGQVNALMEADAEIIKLSGREEAYLVLKIDSIHEEIKEKLYEDPYLIGWMTVTAPVSDMATVGAQPTGILLSLVLLPHVDTEWLLPFKAGINDACQAYGIYVLGGDTNFDTTLSVSATAVALMKDQKPLLRTGMKPGDYLYATAAVGLGNAFAYTRYFNPEIAIKYLPLARLKESRLIQPYATACIDTSDGLFPALAVLSELNGIGFELTTPLHGVLPDSVLPVYKASGIPAWIFLAGPHGEYELLFSIPATNKEAFEKACSDNNWQPILLGEVISDPIVHFFSEDLEVKCQPSQIANLFTESDSNVPLYFKRLMQQHQIWCTL